MRRLIWPAIILSLLPLQGCLLDYFFAPKIAAGELPSDPAMESLRSTYISQCGRCHLLIAPRYFNSERPIESFTDRYVAAKLISRQEADEVATYIRTLRTLPVPVATPRPSPLPTPPEPTSLPTAEPTAEPTPSASLDDTPAPSLAPTEPPGLPIEIPADAP